MGSDGRGTATWDLVLMEMLKLQQGEHSMHHPPIIHPPIIHPPIHPSILQIIAKPLIYAG